MVIPDEREVVFKAIVNYWMEMAIPPTLKDLAKRTNKSVTTVAFHIRNLERAGRILTTPSISRSIRPIGLEITFQEEEESGEAEQSAPAA
jgi:predicted transcriptional regulator